MLNSEVVAIRVAEKARNEWIKKAATFRVEAQEAERVGRIIHGRRSQSATPAELAAHVAKLIAGAEHAEALAREWNAKADPLIFDDNDLTDEATKRDLGLD